MAQFDAEQSKLHLYDDTWELNDCCPCDLQFLDFLKARKIRNATIFHMGTGAHHMVGLHAGDNGAKNAVIAITASPGEHDRYIKLGVENPLTHAHYKAFFGDIYQLDARLLPPLDVATIFHLCEFRTEKNDAYNALTDLEVARLLWDQLKPGGYLLFYTTSFAYPKAVPVIAKLQKQRRMIAEESFKLLQVFRKPGGPKAKAKPKARAKAKAGTTTKSKSAASAKRR